MSRIKNQPVGKTIQGAPTSDINQKLTYQQLLRRNHEFEKENAQLKNIGTRLGNQLRLLHTQFQIKPREENTQLYKAIGSSPELHQFEATLIPLFEAYENKVQQFEHGFETIHEEFFSLEKKFEEVCRENEELKANLTDKSKQLIEVYRNGISGSMQADFGQLILEQINEKQKLLSEQNHMLSKNHQKSSAEAEKYKRQMKNLETELQSLKERFHEKQIAQRQLSAEVKNLKQRNLEFQIKLSELQSEKRKSDLANERAQSLNNQINKEKQFYIQKLEDLRKKVESDKSIPSENNYNKIIEDLKMQISFLEAEKGSDDQHIKLSKMQKEIDLLKNERKQINQTLQSMRLKEESQHRELEQNREEIRELRSSRTQLQTDNAKLNKTMQTLKETSKTEILREKSEKKRAIEDIELEMKNKIELKDRKIAELEESREKMRLEIEKMQKEVGIYGGKGTDPSSKGKSNKQNDRALNKMKDKLKIHEDFFREQTEIYEQDLKSLKNEYDAVKNENKNKGEELKKLKAELSQLQKQLQEIRSSKQILIEEFTKVRDEYKLNLEEKEKKFDQKIREIKAIVQETENKRRMERERVQQASKQYKRVLQDIKSTYEGRIRELQNQIQQVRFEKTVTPKY